MWAGAFTSSVGTWMQEVAQNWLILTMTGSAFLLGLDAFLGDAPFLLFSLFGGVMADRVDRRRILLRSQYVQMSSATLLAALLLAHAVQVWMILTLSFVVGLAQSFGGPAYQALVLANLLGIWLSGCPLHLRDEMMEDFLKRVAECTSLADKVLRENGHPR